METVRDTLSLGETSVTEDTYVTKGLKEPLLGQPAIEKLNLVAKSKVQVKKKGLKQHTLNCSTDWENLRESMKSSVTQALNRLQS